MNRARVHACYMHHVNLNITRGGSADLRSEQLQTCSSVHTYVELTKKISAVVSIVFNFQLTPASRKILY